MKIVSSAEVVVNLGNYQHIKVQTSVEDKSRPGEAQHAAYARVNSLARAALRENVEALTAQLDDWQRDEALKLIGVDTLKQIYEAENEEGDAGYNILSVGFVDDGQDYRTVWLDGRRLLGWSPDPVPLWSWELDGGEAITINEDGSQILAHFPVGTHFVILTAALSDAKAITLRLPIWCINAAAPVVEKAVDDDAIPF